MGLTAGEVAKAGVNLTDFAVHISRSSISLMNEAWRGVDLTDASVNAAGARWFIHSGIDPIFFFHSRAAPHLVRLPPKYLQILMDVMSSVSHTMPVIEDVTSELISNTSFVQFEYQVRLLHNGFIGVQYFFGQVNFTVRWSNPLWEMVQLDVGHELETIQAELQATVTRALSWPYRYEQLGVHHMHGAATVTLPFFRLWYWRLWYWWYAPPIPRLA
jgi:hypothetical protein